MCEKIVHKAILRKRCISKLPKEMGDVSGLYVVSITKSLGELEFFPIEK